ncbi:helix-turn-helix domain-containing protein [Streptomyces hundungensis]|uniref:helix-turn-helix domain-containing protein n=1 Tax=Streptomyces hundungensis TaxID=1077946 RepID=UPI0033C4890C
MTDEQVRHARDLLARPENTVTSIVKLLGVSRNTIYNYVPELKDGRVALAEAPSTPGLPQPARSEDWSPPFAAGDSVLTGTSTSAAPHTAAVRPASRGP